MLIDVNEIESDCSNHELARLAAVYALPPHLREHESSGDQLPRLFPREHQSTVDNESEKVVSDAARHVHAVEGGEKTLKRGLHAKYWRPMEGEFSASKRCQEIETAIALLEAEKKRLSQ